MRPLTMNIRLNRRDENFIDLTEDLELTDDYGCVLWPVGRA